MRRLRPHPLQEEEEAVEGADLEVVAGRPRAQHVGQLERDVLQAVRQDLLRQVGEERPLTGIKLSDQCEVHVSIRSNPRLLEEEVVQMGTKSEAAKMAKKVRFPGRIIIGQKF